MNLVTYPPGVKPGRGVFAYGPEGLSELLDAANLPLVRPIDGIRVTDAIQNWQARHGLTADEYAPVAWKYVEMLTSKDRATPTLDGLQSLGVLEVRDRGKYRPGTAHYDGECRHFRLMPEWRNRPAVRVLVTGRVALKKLAAKRAKDYDDAVAIYPAAAAIARHLPRFVVTGKPAGVDPALDAHASGCGCYLVDSSGRRLHFSMICVCKENRGFVAVGGEPVYAVDVVNCQPLIACVATLPAPGKPQRGERRREAERRAGASPSIFVSGFRLSLSDKILKDECLQVCLRGEFYQEVAADSGLDIPRVKMGYMLLAFGSPRHAKAPGALAIAARFPDFARRLAAWKSARGGGRAGGVALACHSQRIESAAVLGVAAPLLDRDWPGVVYATQHDSLLGRKRDAPCLADAMRAGFRAVVGVEPALKSSPWGKPAG